MLNLGKMVTDGVILAFLASLHLIITLRLNPRIFLQDYPKDIQASVPPKTPQEKQQSLLLGIPFLLLLIVVPFVSTLTLKYDNHDAIAFLPLFINAFGVGFVFNLTDWLLLDWVLFCTLTPRFVVIPGTEGMPGYKDYAYHFRGFLIGTVVSAIGALLISGIVWFL